MLGKFKFGFSILMITIWTFIFCVGVLGLSYANLKEILIPTPDPCYYVSRIDKNKVFLERKKDSTCSMVISFVKVKVDVSDVDYLEIYVDGRFWLKTRVRGEVIDDIVERMFYIANGTRSVLDRNNFGPREDIMREAERYAREVYEYYRSDEFQSKVRSYKEDLMSNLTQGRVYSDLHRRKSEVGGLDRLNALKEKRRLKLAEDERVYIFVSSSLPVETVRNYVKQACEIFDIQDLDSRVFFVLRGGVGGLTRITPTVDWVLSVISKDERGCVDENCEVFPVNFIIDPFLYSKYGISKVPAVVYVKGLFGQELGLVSEGSNTIKIGKAFVRYGDVSLYRHLEKIFEAFGEGK